MKYVGKLTPPELFMLLILMQLKYESILKDLDKNMTYIDINFHTLNPFDWIIHD